MYRLWWSMQVLLKKTLKKATKYCLWLFSDVIIQTNKLFIFRDFLNFTAKCTEGETWAFSFLFLSLSFLVMQKVQKVESVNIQSDCKTTSKKRTDSILCVYMQWKSIKRWTALIHIMIMKQWVKNEQIKKKTSLSCMFC